MRFTYLVLSTLTVLPLTSHAVVNGSSVDWSQQDNSVRFDSQQTGRQGLCTGTIIAGRYVLTAAHCLEESELDSFTTSALDNYPASNRIIHPNYFEDDGFSSEDAGLVIIDTPIDYKAFQPFNIQEHKEGEAITVVGFGGTIDTLNAVSLTFSHYHWADNFAMYSDVVSIDSHTTTGDSGSAWVINDEIVAVHNGSVFNSSTNERPTYGTDIRALQEFLTSNIDGWHYPTLADANGKTTITVQSLHRNETTDTAYTEGDVRIINGESSCRAKVIIEPFEQCTYVIESNGEEGKLFLSNSESIHINKPQDNSGGGDNSSGDSGGSLGFWTLLLLSIASLRRKH
jgi:V8-like Glu-specific endopeptidase